MAGPKVLVLGGTRSGKSSYALELAGRLARGGAGSCPKGLYIATARALDPEMARRIQEHRKERGDTWDTLEEPLDLAGALTAGRASHPVVLIDCLTLWLTNLLSLEEETRSEKIGDFYEAVEACEVPVVMVSNEVGMGLVPPQPLGRAFRDLAGRVHQELAARCQEVILVVAGLPLVLKGGRATGYPTR